MMIGRAVIRVPFLAALLSVLCTRSAAPGSAAVWTEVEQPHRLRFRSAFAGVSPDGANCVWQGSVDGATRGALTFELRQVEDPSQAANPVWHVATHWSVEDPSNARSFDAQLEGMVDWRTGDFRLSGEITEGWMKGAWVQEEGRFVDGDAAGSLVIGAALAGR